MKFLRYYPRGVQLLIFITLFISIFLAANVVIPGLLSKIFGFNISEFLYLDEKSPRALINAAIVFQGITSVFVFLVPAYLFAYLAHPKPAQYIGLNKVKNKMQLLMVVLLILGAMPVLQSIENLLEHINLGEKIRKSQEEQDNLIKAFLVMPVFTDFLKAFLVMAIIPAFGEEFFFRGIVMRFSKSNTKNIANSIMFSGAVFAIFHGTVYGFLSIFLAGILLGVIFYVTGSLWCSIVAHLFFNGSQIILSYFSRNLSATNPLEKMPVLGDVLFVVSGGILFIFALRWLLKNKTPLPEDWPRDFDKEEILELQN